jgi:hypothetical protein
MDSLESKQKYREEFGKNLNDADVTSFCYISGFRIGGRQVFPSEIIRKAN